MGVILLHEGDVFTIEGVYKPQRWWQRLLRHPKELQVFILCQAVTSEAPRDEDLSFPFLPIHESRDVH
jgi:hypothetical protein